MKIIRKNEQEISNKEARAILGTLPLIYACLLGLVGFLCGFFGPLYFSPEANQGPLLGIFITGPLGVALGLMLGAIVNTKQPQTVIATPIIAALILSIFSLYRSLPEDRFRGSIIDSEVRGCQSPSTFVPAAVAQWEKEIGQSTPEYKYRPGWKKDVHRMLAIDKGVVLTLQVHRKKEIFEQGKPWNHGQLLATRWKNVEGLENYFERRIDSSCSDYKIGQRSFYSPVWEESEVLPSNLLPRFLVLYTLQGVPPEFQEFTK